VLGDLASLVVADAAARAEDHALAAAGAVRAVVHPAVHPLSFP
jgi:hypothetical protein